MSVKKFLLLILILNLIFTAYAADINPKFEIVREYENSSEKGHFFYVKKNVGPYDDDTSGNKFYFDKDGIPYVYQYDSKLLFVLDKDDFSIKEVKNFNLPDLTGFIGCTDDYLVFGWTFSNFLLINKNTDEREIYVELEKYNIQNPYYDRQCNILFFYNSKGKLMCIENPVLNKDENVKNFKDVDMTVQLLKSDKYKPYLGIINNVLLQNGEKVFLNRPKLGKYYYQIVTDKKISLTYNGDGIGIYLQNKDDELIESLVLHPSGDIYKLSYNQENNKHTLYRVENTWDPKWRKQWYKKHK